MQKNEEMMQTKRVLSGVQPSGCITLGNYLGAIRNWVAFQKTHDCFFFIVDLHAITVPQDPALMAHYTRKAAAAYIASGIDPALSTIFVQSHVPQHAELAWLLNCITPLGWLNRMTQFKDKAGKDQEKACLGLYSYPVLMAADILLYHATHVPVGDDQKQHLELARDIAGAFNHRYQTPFFTLPEPQIMGPVTRVMSLRNGTVKMSKSDPSEYARIGLEDSDEAIALKIRKATTDPHCLPDTAAGLEGRPEAKNLVSIYAALADMTLDGVCAQYAGATFAPFKKDLADLLIAQVSPLRSEMERLLSDAPYLDDILRRGAVNAGAIARKTLVQTQDIMGLLPR